MSGFKFPDITGNIGGLCYAKNNGVTDGAFEIRDVFAKFGGGTNISHCQSQFDAKRYDETYGRSTTVQSSAFQALIIIKI